MMTVTRHQPSRMKHKFHQGVGVVGYQGQCLATEDTGGEKSRSVTPFFGVHHYMLTRKQPGTSSALPYILVSTLPTPGSSGGPIIDAESGSVVGMISGRRMDNRVEKERGWGSSAESIFEVSHFHIDLTTGRRSLF